MNGKRVRKRTHAIFHHVLSIRVLIVVTVVGLVVTGIIILIVLFNYI